MSSVNHNVVSSSLQILSIMLYSLKKEIGSLAERKDPGLEERNQDQAVDQSVVAPTDADQNRLDPLEGLDEATKICFLVLFDNGWEASAYWNGPSCTLWHSAEVRNISPIDHPDVNSLIMSTFPVLFDKEKPC